MDQADIQRFIDFVELDQRLDRLILEQKNLENKDTILGQEIDSIEVATQEALHRLNAARKQIDSVELELKVLGEKLREKASKIQRAASPKEFFSLEHEMKDLEKKQVPLEEQGLLLLEQLEEAQKAYDTIKAREPEERTLLEKRREDLTKDRLLGEQLIRAYTEQKIKDAQVVQPDLLSRYKDMKLRVANPVIPLVNRSCSSCFYAVSQPDIIEASHGKLVTCRDCYRLLYSTQLPEKDQDAVKEKPDA
jgi:predicted  nucleic acid-binding Zn-ribbon protein